METNGETREENHFDTEEIAMAVRSKTQLITPMDGPIEIWQWTGLTKRTLDTGDPLNLPHFADRSVQVKGTFGTGGTVIIEGSNDRETDTPTYAPLVDPQGNAISFTAAGIEQILESTYLIRPRVTAGDSTTDLTVTILVRR